MLDLVLEYCGQEIISQFQIFHPMMKRKFETQLLTLDKYLNLYVPAVDWLLHGTLNSNKCKDTLLDELLQKCEDMENKYVKNNHLVKLK